MRSPLIALSWTLSWPTLQAQIVINEVQAAGEPGDRVELFNAGSIPANIDGFRFCLNGKTHRVDSNWVVPPKGYAVLEFDGDHEQGAAHADLKLPRRGGTLLLIAADGTTILDLFTWKSLPAGVSYGRRQDAGRDAVYFAEPGFGTPNEERVPAHHVLDPPVIDVSGDPGHPWIRLHAAEGQQVVYTLDGTMPAEHQGTLYTGPFASRHGMTITARCIGKGGIASGPAIRTIMMPPDGRRMMALVADPADLWGDDRGIDTEGLHANYSRRGRAWVRDGSFQFDHDTLGRPVHFRIGGSGSRGLPKRSFTLDAAEGTFSCEGQWRTITLRADATPHAFLRNLFMECIARASGARVDVQPSTPTRLLINGRDHGLYRVMPAKNAAWVKSLSGGTNIDLLEGPGLREVKGERGSCDRFLDLLTRGAPIDSIEQVADIASLIDLACFDLYTGRADHDLNVRCWRPRSKEGRWRWILYDMDLWAPCTENGLERMLSATTPEAPYLTSLFAHPELRDRTLARIIVLLNTTLSVSGATLLADSLYSMYRSLMGDDHQRWHSEMTVPEPEAARAALREHITHRQAILMAQLARHTGLDQRTVDVEVDPPGGGEVLLDELLLTSDRSSMIALAGVPLVLKAIPNAGFEFIRWEPVGSPDNMITIDPARVGKLRAVFRAAGLSGRNRLQQAGE